MNDPATGRDALRQQFLDQAGAAFDLMFDEQLANGLVTFDQREQRAAELGQQLIVALLQQHLRHDPDADPDPQQPPLCPRCQRPGRRLTPPGQPLPERQLTTCSGDITFSRARYRCTTCRVVFFPPRRAPAPVR
jgi:hypothetical protein